LHVGNMIEGHLRVGEHVTATLAGVRPRTEKNHTATHLANWAHTLIFNALGAAGALVMGKVTTDLVGKMAGNGVFFEGLGVLGSGSILTGVILASVGVFIIDRQFMKAAAFAFAGAVFTFFGLMHNEHIGLPANGLIAAVAIAYMSVSCILFGCAYFVEAPAVAPAMAHDEEEDEMEDMAIAGK